MPLKSLVSDWLHSPCLGLRRLAAMRERWGWGSHAPNLAEFWAEAFTGKQRKGAGSCCWCECLTLRGIPPFSGPSCLSSCATWAFCSCFSYLSQVTPTSASVLNLPYPYSYNTLCSWDKKVSVNNLQLFCGREGIAFSTSLQIFMWMFPSSLPPCDRTPLPSLPGKVSVATPLTCVLGSWILLLFAGSEHNRSISLEKPCSKNTLTVFNFKKPLQKCRV